MKEVKLPHFAGPVDEIPFDNFIQSPIGLAPKGGNETRLIFHLSHPQGDSVNSNTPKELCSVQCKDLDSAVLLCMQVGKGCFLAKSDFKSVFRILPIKPSDCKLLVIKAQHPLTGKIKYFIDKCLPFGSSISCAHFQRVSNAIQRIYQHKSGSEANNYLDDFLILALLQMQQKSRFIPGNL